MFLLSKLKLSGNRHSPVEQLQRAGIKNTFASQKNSGRLLLINNPSIAAVLRAKNERLRDP